MPTPVPPSSDTSPRDALLGAIPFILVHLACLGALWTGVHGRDVAIAVGLYFLRMFGVTAGYHRYFSHRAFKTSRWFQFVLAVLAEMSAQRGVLWWAAKHRHHHRYSDTVDDVHSPLQRGFFYAHVGWIFDKKHDSADMSVVPDLTRYPELVWLDRHYYVPAAALAVLVWALAGWSGLVVGFFWSTVAVYHATFCINSLAHVYGKRRYLTGDDSRNNWWFALLAMGEGWHNNHHAYQSAACQGFRWYEVDLSYYILRALSWMGVVWDLHRPPAAVVRCEQRLGSAIIEKAAAQLAATFPTEQIAARVTQALAGTPSLATIRQDIQDALAQARSQAGARLAALQLPLLPTRDEVKDRAAAMFVRTPSMDDIVERARLILIEAVCVRLAAA